MLISDIKPYERNARHNDKAIPKVAESIRKFGLRGSIVLESREPSPSPSPAPPKRRSNRSAPSPTPTPPAPAHARVSSTTPANSPPGARRSTRSGRPATRRRSPTSPRA